MGGAGSLVYREGKSRSETYQQMVEAMLSEVRAGKRVCGAFYGHPGVFALPTHRAIQIARREGFSAHMEPGVSAEDCLYADLGIDPGKYGCQHYEASQFMLYRRRIDTSAYLVLWQVGVAGDQSFARFSTAGVSTQNRAAAIAKTAGCEHRYARHPGDSTRQQPAGRSGCPGVSVGSRFKVPGRAMSGLRQRFDR